MWLEGVSVYRYATLAPPQAFPRRSTSEITRAGEYLTRQRGDFREAHVSTKQTTPGSQARLPEPHVHQGGSFHYQVATASRKASAVSLIWRLRGQAAFAALHRSGQRATSGPITILFLATNGELPRVAFAIGKEVGTAVRRNRLRRQIRAEMARQARCGELAQGDYLVRVRSDLRAPGEVVTCLISAQQKLNQTLK